MAEEYIGGNFLNYMLSEGVRLFCGFDITDVRAEDEW